jgi:hypothetical protein
MKVSVRSLDAYRTHGVTQPILTDGAEANNS